MKMRRYLNPPFILAGIFLLQSMFEVGNASDAEGVPPGCQPDLIAKASGLSYAYSVRSISYCDGTLPIQHRGELQVVSFTLGPVFFDVAQHILVIKDESADDHDVPLYITGLHKGLGGSYRLDGVVPHEGLEIDLDAVVHPQQIMKEELGLLAWTGSVADRIYRPVSAGAKQSEKNNAILALRSPSAIIEASIQVCEHGGHCSAPKIIGRNVLGGSLIEVRLPRTGKTQDLELTLTAVGPGRIVSAEVLNARVN